MARSSLAILAALALAGCATTSAHVCPTITTYSAADQKAAAAELAALPPGSVLARFIADYGALRAQVRACETAH